MATKLRKIQKEKKKVNIKKKKSTKKSVITSFFISLLLGLLLFFFIKNLDQNSEENFVKSNPEWTHVDGKILSVTPIISGSQGRFGSSSFISAYNVKYTYKADGEVFTKDAFLKMADNGNYIKSIAPGMGCRVYHNTKKGTSYLDKEYVKEEIRVVIP